MSNRGVQVCSIIVVAIISTYIVVDIYPFYEPESNMFSLNQNVHELNVTYASLESIAINMSYTECINLMNDSLLHFMDANESNQIFKWHWPTWLLSYGGSGNTVTRIIIEYITSIWSGAIGDPSLRRMGFVGEGKCNHKTGVVIVKTHPEHKHHPERMPNDCWGGGYKKGSIPSIHAVTVIFIVRNPFKSIFAMYNFKYGIGSNKHIRTTPMSNWNLTQFIQFVFKEAIDLHEMRVFIDYINSKIDSGKDNYKYIIVKFEDFFNSKTAFVQMDKILRFLYNEYYYIKNMRELHQRIRCVTEHFLPNDYDRFGRIHRDHHIVRDIVTFDFAFNEFYKHNIDKFCMFWSQIKWVAIDYGYQNLPYAQCND